MFDIDPPSPAFLVILYLAALAVIALVPGPF